MSLRFQRIVQILLLSFVLSVSNTHAAPTAADFGALPSIYDMAISPNGENLAMFINYKGDQYIRVVRVDGKGGANKIAGLGKGTKPKWIKWANDNRVLAGLWQSEKTGTTAYEVSGIYTLDATTMKGKYLVKPRGQFRQFNDDVIDFLEHDPNHILMSYSDKDANAPDIQRVNVATGKDQRLKRGNIGTQQWFTDNRGEPRIGQGRYDNTAARWTMTIRDADENKWRNVNEFPGLEANDNVRGFTDNPNELILGRYNGKDTVGLYVYDLIQKRITRSLFHNDQYDAGAIITNQDGKVIGATYVSDAKERVLFDGDNTIMSRLQQEFPGQIVDYIDQSRGGVRTIFSVSDSKDPGMIYMYDAKDNSIAAIGGIRQNLALDSMGHVLAATYPARDGEIIPGYMTVPATITDNSQIKQLPFIVLPHGGPYARDSKRFDYLAQYFANQGYGVFQMNFRGSAGYGKSFKDAGRENWVVMQEDVEDATKMLISKGYADPKRICIAGWSYGGYASLMGGIKNPELYKCIVSIAGVTDLSDMINDLKKYQFGNLAAKDFVLKGFKDKDAIRENSPLRRADEIKVPVFLAHGTYDQSVHFDQYSRMRRALKKHKVQHTALSIKKEDHYMSTEKNRIAMFEALDKFIKTNLGPSSFAP